MATDRSGRTDDNNQTTKKAPFQQPKSQDFFESLKKNDVLKCLNMLKENWNLVDDCDDERKTPLHWSMQLDHTNLSEILIDFGAPMWSKDDFSRKPYDEAVAFAQGKGKPVHSRIQLLYDKAAKGILRKDTSQYDQPLYVKYLTPVEQVKELADFINRVNDMSTLKSPRDKTKHKSGADSDYSEDVEHQVNAVAKGMDT